MLSSRDHAQRTPKSCSSWLGFTSPVLLMLMLQPVCSAQTPPPPAGGTISGHVVFADNDRPARFATLYLKAVEPPSPQDDFFTVLMESAITNMQGKQGSSGEDAAKSLQAARTATSNFLTSVSDSMLCASIDADGAYTITGVPPGTYYLHVKAPGYVDSLAQFTPQDLTSADPNVRKHILATVATVTVAGIEHVREDLRLERGATLAGRLLYDDGSPAAGWTVTALLKRNAAEGPPPNILGIDLSQLPIGQKLDHAVTDDTGRFRIAGLPTGEYVEQATLLTATLDRQPFAPVASSSGSFLSILSGVSEMSALRLSIYSGSKIHLREAQTFSLRAGEDRTGPDLTIPLSATHSIHGFLVAQSDGHALNQGTVQLLGLDSDGNPDPNLQFSTSVRPDGSFRFDYIPGPSSFRLVSAGAADSSGAGILKLLGSTIAQHKINRTYAPATLTVELKDGDLTGLKLVVEETRNTALASH